MSATTRKANTTINPAIYTQLPTDPNTQYVVVLQPYPYTPTFTFRRCLIFLLSTILLSSFIFLIYPSNPKLQLTYLKLKTVKVNSTVPLSLDLSFAVTVLVRNRDVFSLEYDSLDVGIEYRGRELGVMKFEGGGVVKAMGKSYVEAEVEMNGLEIVHDVFSLLRDLAREFVPFDTVSKVDGKLGLFVFRIPIKSRVSCEVLVSTKNQTVVRQDCYPE